MKFIVSRTSATSGYDETGEPFTAAPPVPGAERDRGYWSIEVGTLGCLLDLIRREGGRAIVFSQGTDDEYNDVELPEVEIYDDYRE